MFTCIVCAAAGGMTKRLNIPNNMHAVKKVYMKSGFACRNMCLRAAWHKATI